MAQSLIEQWFPATAVGAESLRERATFTALPAPFALHVWWARRPLIASRAAVLTSLLPAWPSPEEAQADSEARSVLNVLLREFPNGEDGYHAWLQRVLGIKGDPVERRAAIAVANRDGIRLPGNAYGYERAFTYSPDKREVDLVQDLVALRTGSRPATVLDPFAGGGSIPLEATRYGFDVTANELNPVAVSVLEGTIRLPLQLPPNWSSILRQWGETWLARTEGRLAQFFPRRDDETIVAYIWAHTVPCPSTGHPTPLAPNYWLSAGRRGHEIAVALDPNPLDGTIETRVVRGPDAIEFGRRSTYSRGVATSVWDPAVTLSGSDINELAQQGQLGQVMLAVCVSRPGSRGRDFRAPASDDYEAAQLADAEVARCMPRWLVEDLVPTEPVPAGEKTDEPRRMGLDQWHKMFAPRQLLTHAVAQETLQETLADARSELGDFEWHALALYLGFVVDKALNYNSRMSTWHPYRDRIANTFDRHDFGFKWSFAEFDGSRALHRWGLDQVCSTYSGTADLLSQDPKLLSTPAQLHVPNIILGSATDLNVPSGTIDAVVTDPPYYDNVMYAECADFFYVWMKRAYRGSWDGLITLPLTEKRTEVVANPSVFRELATHSGRGRRQQGTTTATELADRHYEALLTDAFREAHRVLKDDGTLTVMFTHKRVDAWDTLGAALLESGFEILSSWPVHTEAENSLHQAKKNSASSTIMLGCRKRGVAEATFWSDLKSEVEAAAEAAAMAFFEQGIRGVDLTLSTYGPALSVLSRNWPVFTGNLLPDGERERMRPDVALDLARHRVAQLKKRELLAGQDVDFDAATDWWLLAWSDFQAAQFPAGEAIKLCMALDIELETVSRMHKLVKAQSGDVTLLTPAQRRTAGALDPESIEWDTWVDALHCLMLIYDEEGLAAARSWLEVAGLSDDQRFVALVRAGVHAVPRVRAADEFARPEARVLESIRASLFGDSIAAPQEPEIPDVQATLFDQD